VFIHDVRTTTFAPVATLRSYPDRSTAIQLQEQIMKRTLATAFVVALVASAPAFAGGIGLSGAYGPQRAQSDNSAPLTRAEVRAQIVDAYRDGTLPSLNKTSYPAQSLEGRTQAERVALQEGRDDATRLARAGE
jgi:hypothetical protein